MPAYFQDWLFDYVAVILYNTNRMFNSLWSESKLQGSVARDYSIFFWIVAFGAYLLSVTWADITNEAWVCEGACDTAEDEDTDEAYDLEGGEKFNPGIALKLMARAVPRHAWPFASIFLMQIGDMVADALRVRRVDNVASMARGARNLISTQARRRRFVPMLLARAEPRGRQRPGAAAAPGRRREGTARRRRRPAQGARVRAPADAPEGDR